MKILASTPLKYNYNTLKQSNNKQKQEVAFGANPLNLVRKTGDLATDGLAYGFGWLSTTKPVQNLIDFLKETNYQRHISAFVGVVLSSFYMLDTARSKTIEKDQKMPLIMNQATVSVLSTAGAYTLDNWLDKKFAKMVDTIHIANISDKNAQKAMMKYHSNKEDITVLEEAVKSMKTPNQQIEKRILDALDNPENLEKVKKSLEQNKHAKELFAELKNSDNPKELLQSKYDKTDEFAKELKNRFQLKNKDIKKLKKMILEDKADETTKELVNDINNIAKTETDKLGKATEMFLKKMPQSELLKKMYSKAGFENSINLLAEADEKLSKRIAGFKFAKSMMVFAMIYRFISPVIATPIANSVSSKIEAHKRQKLA